MNPRTMRPSRSCASFTAHGTGAKKAGQSNRLRERGVNLSTSSTAGTRLDAAARGLPTVVRASPHYYNSEDEIAQAAQLVAEIASE